jgi:CheY-like chemotaxis protein
MTGDRDRYLGAGFDDYVTKPIVDETVLLAIIERLLNAREVR